MIGFVPPKTGWLVRYISHFSLLLPSAQSMPPSSMLLSSQLAPTLTEQAPGMHTALCQEQCPPKNPPKWWGFPKQNPLKAERRIFSSRNWSHAHVSAADTWDVRALNLSHSTFKVSSPRVAPPGLFDAIWQGLLQPWSPRDSFSSLPWLSNTFVLEVVVRMLRALQQLSNSHSFPSLSNRGDHFVV